MGCSKAFKIRPTAFLVVLLLENLQLQTSLGSYEHPKTLAERQAIVKRLAKSDQVYTDHDVAVVLHEKEPNSFHSISRRDLRRITDDDRDEETMHLLRLKSSSGSVLHLRLQKRSLFSPDTQFVERIHGQRRRMRLKTSSTSPLDCYATGYVEADGGGISAGFVSVATCDGLHGTAVINGTEFYIHPVSHSSEGEHQVHILSRRISDDAVESMSVAEVVDDDEQDREEHVLARRYKRSAVTKDTYKTATSLVIELAVILDERFWKKLQTQVTPGREHERLFTSLSAVNAVYSNPDKLGYKARMKIKLYETWLKDPEGYEFKQDLLANLKSFCKYTTPIYKYDLHYLFTGITKPPDAAVGRAYDKGMCSNTLRCATSYGWGTQLVSHEIGHTLSFKHLNVQECPKELQGKGNGIMGSGYDITPCNKWELNNFLSKGNGQCLFEETGEVKTSEKYENLPQLFEGQHRNTEEWCKYDHGEDYEVYRPYDFHGNATCYSLMCINRNKASPEYLLIRRRNARWGFTCDQGMFCEGKKCLPWDKKGLGWNPSDFEKNRRENKWSQWSSEWSTCSKTCGKGVQTKTRRCVFASGPFLSPHCRGLAVQARLCNQDPCPENEPTSAEQRRNAGNTVCKTFLDKKAKLDVQKGSVYTAKSTDLFLWSHIKKTLETKSCLLMCIRDPARYNYIDSFYPDGTPCTETDKTSYQLENFNVALRCVQGVCMEFSDCRNNAKKDVCGVCGGDTSRCVNKVIEKSGDVPAVGERKIVATIPTGARSIDIVMITNRDYGGSLELWNSTGTVIGPSGHFEKNAYEGENAVSYANTDWIYKKSKYLRADGPIDQEVVVKAYRDKKPIAEISVTYLLASSASPVSNDSHNMVMGQLTYGTFFALVFVLYIQ